VNHLQSTIAISHQPSAIDGASTMKRIALAIVASLTITTISAQSGDPTLAKIRTEGLEHSQVQAIFDYLTINIGPRLTASPAHKRAVEWTRDRLSSYGLANVHVEPWKFGRGWELQKLTVEMIEPRYLPLIGYADGWSASTNGEIVAAPVLVAGKSAEEIAAMGASLKGAIVLT
jgi:carboxypeptidase Q